MLILLQSGGIAIMNKNNQSSPPLTLIAHRGYSTKYPENTLLAYQAAYAFGARWMECDIQLTNDLIPVLQHDESLLRMTGVNKDVRKISNKQFKKLSAYYPDRFGDAFYGNTTTTLKKLAKWMRTDSDIRMFIEVKQHSIDTFGVEACARSIFERTLDIKDQSIMISFNYELVKTAREMFDFEIGWVIPKWSEVVEKQAYALQPNYLFSNKNLLPENPNDWWQGSWQLAIYNVDELSEVPQWTQRGIHMIETNEIGALLNPKELP